MSDSTITIILVTCVILLMFLFPFLFITAQQDTINANEVKNITENFINRVAKEGKITKSNYEEFKNKLNGTGNGYNVELEVQICNNYPEDYSNKHFFLGENMYYSEFTDEIEKVIYDEGEYELKKGDYIKAKVENNNITLATNLKRMIYGLSGKDYSTIYSNISELVVATTQGDGIAKDPDHEIISLKSLSWNTDYYWTGKFNPAFGENMNVRDGSISRINIIGDDTIQMNGNSVFPGKGAAWATAENANITKMTFEYNLKKGDSFIDGGMMFNVKRNGDYLERIFIMFNV